MPIGHLLPAPSVAAHPLQGAGATTCPPDLLTRIARAHADVEAALPALDRAAAVRDEAIAWAAAAVSGVGESVFSERTDEVMRGSGAAELAGLLWTVCNLTSPFTSGGDQQHRLTKS